MNMDKHRDRQIKRAAQQLAWNETNIRMCALDLFGKAYHELDNDEGRELLQHLREQLSIYYDM